jgi:thiamine monophosphate synthase
VFDTASKHDPEATLGLAGLETLARRARAQTAVPLVAIGGIGPDRAREIAAICPSVAAIGALVGSGAHPYDDATRRARAFIDALAEADGST